MRICTLIVTLALSLLPLQAVCAADDLDAHHPRLRLDSNLSLSELVNQTLARTPDLRLLDSRAAVASAWRDRSTKWLPNAPTLSMRYQTGRFNQTDDVEEFEAGIALPLWRRGEKAATQHLAQSLFEETHSARDLLRWRVAGAVRDALWLLAASEADLSNAQRLLEVATHIQAQVERGHELGELALGDVLVVRSNALQARKRVIELEAAVLDATRTFAVLTQDSVRPAYTPEVLSVQTDLPPNHVLLEALKRKIARADANRDRLQRTSRGNPSLLIGPRREQAPGDLRAFDSVGITLSVPLAGGAYNKTSVATAAQATAELVAERDHQLRALKLMFHEAAHELEVIDKQLAASTEGAAVARQQIKMAQSAFAAGELNLLDLLQIQNTAFGVLGDAEQLAIARNHTIARYNQALGETP